MTNPCLDCKNKDNDKNNPECRECSLRVQYIKSIGPMTCSSDFETGGHKVRPYGKTGDKNIMENIKEKICKKCGNSFPATAEYFHGNKNTKDGLQIHCKTCRSIQAKEYKKRRRLAATGQPQGAATTIIYRKAEKNQVETGLKKASMTKPADNILSISFADYPEILKEIKKIAKEEFRKPEQQILFWIAKNFCLK